MLAKSSLLGNSQILPKSKLIVSSNLIPKISGHGTSTTGGGSKDKIPRIITRYGGKGNMLDLYMPYIKCIAEAAGCDTFVDLFGGGGTASFGSMQITNKEGNPLFKKVIYNELEKSVTVLFKVVQNRESCTRLIDKLLRTEYCKQTFNVATRFLDCYNQDGFMWNGQDDVMVAWAEFVKNRMSYNGAGQNFRDYTKYEYKGGFIDYAKQFKNAAKRLVKAHEALQNIEIRQGDYSVVLSEHKDNPKAFFFIDPPYLDVERAENAEDIYRHEFSKDDHMLLLQRLSECQHWMLCGYRGIAEPDGQGKCRDTGKASEIYDFIEGIPGVKRIDLGLVWKPSSGKTKEVSGSHEFIWVRA